MVHSPFGAVFQRLRSFIRSRVSQDVNQGVLGMEQSSCDEMGNQPLEPASDTQLNSQSPMTPPAPVLMEDQRSSEKAIPEEVVEPVVTPSVQENHICKADALLFCPEQTSSRSVFNVLHCLQNHLDNLTSTCKEQVERSPVFNCAMDAAKFCSNMPQASVPGCLRGHFADLSDTCVHQMIHQTPGQKDVKSSSANDIATPTLLTPHGDSWQGLFMNMLNEATVAKVVSILVAVSLMVIFAAVVYLCSRRKRQQAHIRLQILRPPVISSVTSV